ncbi:MAG TPA: hypothetical protein VH593_14290, partial [Ktedonobacteraceae bacterium]
CRLASLSRKTPPIRSLWESEVVWRQWPHHTAGGVAGASTSAGDSLAAVWFFTLSLCSSVETPLSLCREYTS